MSGRFVPRARQAAKLPDRLLRRLDRWPEDSGLGDGVEGIARIDDARTDWDCFAYQPIRVTRTVPALMVMADNQRDVLLLRMFSQDLSSLDRMLLDDFVFLGSQLARLEEDRVWDRDLAQVVEIDSDANRVADLDGNDEPPHHACADL